MTVTLYDSRAVVRIRDGKKTYTTPNGIPSFSTGQPRGTWLVDNAMLKDLLEPLLENLNAELGLDRRQASNRAGGAIECIAARAALTLKMTPTSVVRRLSAVRRGESRALPTETADALLLAVGVNIEDTNLPIFPSDLTAAREQVDFFFVETIDDDDVITFKPDTPSEAERDKLARMLLSFTRGILADQMDECPDIEEWATRVARFRLRTHATRENSRAGSRIAAREEREKKRRQLALA